MTYDHTNKGTYNHNDRKEQENHPDKVGKLNVEGRWYWLSGWEKSGPHGNFDSLAIREMTPEQVEKYAPKSSNAAPAQGSAPQQQDAGIEQDGWDDEVPF